MTPTKDGKNPDASTPAPGIPTSGMSTRTVAGEPHLLEYESSQPKIFTAGTLKYTTAGLVMLFFWLLLGDFAYAIRERSAHQVVQLALRRYEASNTFQAWVLVVMPHAVALILQPIIAYKSDRYRSRWGRRIPFLFWTTPLTFLSMIGLAACPWLADRTVRLYNGTFDVAQLTRGYFAFFYFVFELACITSITLFTALVNDVVPRAVIGRFYGAFRAVSLAAGIVFSSQLLKWAETHFVEVFTGIGIVFGGGFLLMCLFVKEGEYPPPAPAATPSTPGTAARATAFGPVIAAVRSYARECFHHPFYLWVFAAMLLANLTFQPFNNFRVVYAKSIGVDLGHYGNIEAISFAVSFLIAFPLGVLVDRFHPLRMGIAAMAVYSVATVFGAFFIRGEATFLAAFMVHTILSGIYFTSTAALGALLFPKANFGQFTAASAITIHLGSMLLSILQGPLLDLSKNANGQTNYAITWMMCGLLCLATLACLIVSYTHFQKLGGQKSYAPPP